MMDLLSCSSMVEVLVGVFLPALDTQVWGASSWSDLSGNSIGLHDLLGGIASNGQIDTTSTPGGLSAGIAVRIIT